MPLRDSLAGRVLRGTGDIALPPARVHRRGRPGLGLPRELGRPVGPRRHREGAAPRRRRDRRRCSASSARPRSCACSRRRGGRTRTSSASTITRSRRCRRPTAPSRSRCRSPCSSTSTARRSRRCSPTRRAAGSPPSERGASSGRCRQALDVVHAQKVVHRDLKPSNILLATEAGTEIAKVTDFGLVKLVEMNLQRTAALAGASLGYAPPEQYEQGNQRVGAAHRRLLARGRRLRDARRQAGLPVHRRREPAPHRDAHPRTGRARRSCATATRSRPSSRAQSPLVEALDRELTRALAADPNARHESIMEFWKAIEPSLRAASEERPRARARRRRRRLRRDGARRERLARPRCAQRLRRADPRHHARRCGLRRAADARRRQPDPRSTDARCLPRPIASPRRRPRAPPHGRGRCSPRRSRRARSAAPCSARAATPPSRSRTADSCAGSAAHGCPRRCPRMSRARRSAACDGSPTAASSSSAKAGSSVASRRTASANLWRVPDTEITFLGAYADASGTTTLVGERPYRGAAHAHRAGNDRGRRRAVLRRSRHRRERCDQHVAAPRRHAPRVGCARRVRRLGRDRSHRARRRRARRLDLRRSPRVHRSAAGRRRGHRGRRRPRALALAEARGASSRRSRRRATFSPSPRPRTVRPGPARRRRASSAAPTRRRRAGFA